MLFTLIFVLLLLLLILAALSIDIAAFLREFTGRIGMGNFESIDECEKAQRKIILKYLNNPPSVPVSDNTRFTILERLNGTYKNKNLQSWQEASILLGTRDLSDDISISDEAKKFIQSKINISSGTWSDDIFSVDKALLAYAILSSPYSDKQNIKPAMDSMYNFLIGCVKEGGTVPYNQNVPDFRFVDTIGMICPYLFEYDRQYGSCDASALSMLQIDEFMKSGLHADSGLPIHAFNVRTKEPLGIYGWGRGCGWLAFGLCESAQAAKTDKDKARLLLYCKNLADSLLKYQNENGGFGRVIYINDNFESSCTAMIGRLMQFLYRTTGNIDYYDSAILTKKFLMSCTRRNGVIDFAQGDTKGIGFYSLNMKPMPAVQGFAMFDIEKYRNNI